jgi:hypothetical protein
VTTTGDTNIDIVSEQAFDTISVNQGAVAGDVMIDQVGGDVIEIVGTAAAGSDPGFSTVQRVDTAASGTGFGYNLSEGVVDGADPDIIIPTGAVDIGGNGLFSATGDLILGDSAGIAVEIAGEGLALEADRNLDGDGGIFNGAQGVEVSANGAQLLLFAGTGIGTPDNPIVTNDVSQLGAEVTEQGGIYVRNRGAGELVIAVTTPPQLGGAIQSVPGLRILGGPGDIDLVHSGGDIVIQGAIRTFDSDGDASITAETDGSVIFFDSDLLIFASTGGSQTYGNPVVIRQNTNLVGADITFLGAIDSETEPIIDPEGDPDDPENLRSLPTSLSILTGGTVSFGGSVGGDAPLTSLRIVDQVPIFDPLTGLITLPEGEILIDGATVATTGTQFFGNSVVLAQDTTFTAAADPPDPEDPSEPVGDAVTFLLSLDGPGGANIEASEGNLVFGGNVGAETSLAGLSVEFTGADPGTITFVGTETVSTGAGGITLSPAGRSEVPEVATIFKTGIAALLNPPDTGFPNTPDPASSVGPLTFTTSGDFVVGRNEKISVADKLSIEANHVEVGDLSAFEIDIDSASYTILGRDPGNVILAGGGEQMDSGVDVVANRVTLAANPDWDGVGTTPTFFTQTGGVDTPGNLQDFDLRQIDERGSKVRLEDFTRPDGTILDLTGNGPAAIGNPATQNVQEGDRLALLIPPSSSRSQASTTSQASAAEVLASLECADIGRGVPSGCNTPATRDDRVLAPARVKQAASTYRETSAGDVGAARDALRDALSAPGVRTTSGAVDGPALRRSVESAPRRDAAVAYLDRRNQILTEVRLLNVSPATSSEVERTLLDRWSSELGLPGVDATVLGSAIGSARNGLVL